jgi:Na+/serine symporter
MMEHGMAVIDTPLPDEARTGHAVRPRWRRWLGLLYVQVLLGMVTGAVIGFVAPDLGVQLKPLGDTFVRLIKMMIGLIVFAPSSRAWADRRI